LVSIRKDMQQGLLFRKLNLNKFKKNKLIAINDEN